MISRENEISDAVDAVAAETAFSGVVRVNRDGGVVFAQSFGSANRAFDRPNTIDTQFGLASGAKSFTALTVVSLVAEGGLALATTARSVLGADLPLIDDSVTVEHLLAHTSGIGDYLDEDFEYDITDYVLAVAPHELANTEDYLQVLDGYHQKFAPGEKFSYCNGGYVVLALIAERVAGAPFGDLVQRRVCRPARLRDTAFLRSDELPARAALGYLMPDGNRTNVLHLPVRGSVGYDAGVSFHSARDRQGAFTYTVISNTSPGAWPIARVLGDLHA